MNLINTLTAGAFAAALLAGCTATKQEDVTTPDHYREKHRPLVHFSPREHWMNDPNGLVYLDGEYHLFYQHYPDSNVWGPMHWGHAVSRDLVRWEELPIALYPDSLGYIFSGSAVVDNRNTSGLGSDGKPALIAIYTYHDVKGERAGRKDYQTQGMAYSLDNGRSWTKYAHNPIVANPGIIDFRDPKVDWNEAAGQWVMTLAEKDHIGFYGSKDLKAWAKLSEFGKDDGDHGGVWECPDLFVLKDERGNSKHVLLVSINPGAPNGGSGTQYFLGTFDGRTFTSDTPGRNAGWVDYGPDNYAGVTFANIPDTDGRRISIGWMTNWNYAQVVPTTRWRGAMTVPRVHALKTIGTRTVLTSQPVSELGDLTASTKVLAPQNADTIRVDRLVDFPVVPAIVTGRVRTSDFVIEMSNGVSQRLRAGFNAAKREYFVDRTQAGRSDFHNGFTSPIVAPRLSDSEWIDFTLIVDVASIELFFDEGATVLSAISFPDENFDKLVLYGTSAPLEADTIKVDQLQRIWK